MRKSIFVMALVVVVVGTALTISFAGNRAVTRPTTLKVIEHAITDKVINTGKTGDTPGDLLTFHNPIFDATNSHKIGHDQGDCIRISPNAGHVGVPLADLHRRSWRDHGRGRVLRHPRQHDWRSRAERWSSATPAVR